MKVRYDYIIAGGGCAGLQLALGLIAEDSLRGHRILILDRAPKVGNDRTWCFWTRDQRPYSNLLFKTWSQLTICAPRMEKSEHIAPYTYGMLRSADFYTYAYDVLALNPQVEFYYGEIGRVAQEEGHGVVWVDGLRFEGRYVFNSCAGRGQLQPKSGQQPFWQHFKGWWIQTEKAAFDPQRATLMDFRIPQSAGLSFMYVLPFSSTEALVEYTVFSASLLEDGQYEEVLAAYLDQQFAGVAYEIRETEKGVIPMFPVEEASTLDTAIIPIGGMAGAIKPTTGYAFMRIQSDTRQLIDQLVRGEKLERRTMAPRFSWYDDLLLHLLQHHQGTGVHIFTRLFQNNPFSLILRFLDEETRLMQEIRIFSGLPIRLFLNAALEVWVKRIRQRWGLATSTASVATNPFIR